MVLADLDAAGSIGTFEEPRGYFAGSPQLRWGSWQDFVYLGGRAGNTVLGLAGSMQSMTSVPGAPHPPSR
jgi:hypothetical protein